MAKKYRPGQFVSICGKLHRVKKAVYACAQCLYIDCKGELSKECFRKLGHFNYPEPIKSE